MNNKAWGGRRAKAFGTSWEEVVKRSCIREGIECLKIEDGCKRVSKDRFIPRRQPLDFVLIKNGKCVLLDAKTINADTLSYSYINESPSISRQLEVMRRISLHKVRAGMLVWFRLSNYISFIDAQLLTIVQPQQGIKYDAGLVLGKWEDFKLAPLFQLDFESNLHDPLSDGFMT